MVGGKTPAGPTNVTGKWRKSKNRYTRDLRNHCTIVSRGLIEKKNKRKGEGERERPDKGNYEANTWMC